MTGYGKYNLTNEIYDIEVEIKSLNSKYFDFRFYSAREYSYLESFANKLIKQTINRGSIECRINITDLSEPLLKINVGKLKAIWEAAQRAKDLLHAEGEVSLDRILLYQGILEMKPQVGNEHILLDSLEKAIFVALEEHQKMAIEEGKIMADFFTSSLLLMREATEKVIEIIPTYKTQIYNKIVDNIKEMLKSEITDDILRRVVVETAFYVDRNDVNEEVVRLLDHINKCENLLKSKDDNIGKSFNFIIQEMHREANTLGSKFSIPETFEYILTIKEEIDKCKEMILNVQ
jgi:uncharacterized protein (TIGR00255 family)